MSAASPDKIPDNSWLRNLPGGSDGQTGLPTEIAGRLSAEGEIIPIL